MYCRETISYLGCIDMCSPNGVRFFSRLGQKLGIDFGNSGPKLGMVCTLLYRSGCVSLEEEATFLLLLARPSTKTRKMLSSNIGFN